MRFIKVAVILFVLNSIVLASTPYIGWSGAPGSRGACSVTCHYRQHFTPSVIITGFPEQYVPGQTYSVEISRGGDSVIKNFNASIRIGAGSENGGTIEAGTNTATYYHSQEANGVHWLGSSQASGTFNWIAPESGTGEVRLYYAGLQGSLSNGSSCDTTLISQELITSVENTHQVPQLFELQQNYPNPFNGETIIKARISEIGKYKLVISNISGQIVHEQNLNIDNPGIVRINWNSKGQSGKMAPSGVYFYTLRGSNSSQTKKMLLLR